MITRMDHSTTSPTTPVTGAPALSATALKKSFGGTYQLGPLDLSLQPGETVGLIGKNGAGKTTLFQLLSGNLDASSGEARVFGHKLSPETAELKRQIGYQPQDPVLPPWATSHEVLNYAAQLHGLPDAAARVASAEAYWDCASYGHKALGTLSYGMQKRVALALACLHQPPCLILDEPFSGLDLTHIKALEGLITARAGAGLTTILSTHVISFCARLCQRAFVLIAGQLQPVAAWQTLDHAAREDAITHLFFATETR